MERKLTYQLIPKSAFYSNVRSLIDDLDWGYISNKVRENCTCEICKEVRPINELHAHEVWEWDTQTHTQKLKDIICVCEDCHRTMHIGLAQVNGFEAEALQQYCKVNNVSMNTAVQEMEAAFITWRELSLLDWHLDESIRQQLEDEFETQIDIKRELTSSVDTAPLNRITYTLGKDYMNIDSLDDSMNTKIKQMFDLMLTTFERILTHQGYTGKKGESIEVEISIHNYALETYYVSQNTNDVGYSDMQEYTEIRKQFQDIVKELNSHKLALGYCIKVNGSNWIQEYRVGRYKNIPEYRGYTLLDTNYLSIRGILLGQLGTRRDCREYIMELLRMCIPEAPVKLNQEEWNNEIEYFCNLIDKKNRNKKKIIEELEKFGILIALMDKARQFYKEASYIGGARGQRTKTMFRCTDRLQDLQEITKINDVTYNIYDRLSDQPSFKQKHQYTFNKTNKIPDEYIINMELFRLI